METNGQTYCSEITLDMRLILIRWLVQVGDKFRVRPETMHICTQLVDYILVFETSKISKQNVQLLGIASLFVACKYNEVHTMEAEKYLGACDGLYSFSELFDMESLILEVTKFNLQFPTIEQFTSQMFHNQQISDQLAQQIRALSNLSIFDFKLFNCYKKMHLSTVIVYFSAKLLNLD